MRGFERLNFTTAAARIVLGIALIAFSAAIGASAVLLSAKTPDRQVAHLGPIWIEVPWPFPVDQWGRGRAFQCRALDCGAEVNLFLRAKIGFCNCTIGVADDEDLDRVGDVDLVGEERRELSSGAPIAVRWMKGRARSYALRGHVLSAKSVLSVAFNDRCDVIVATAVVGSDAPMAQQSAILDFLNSDSVAHWAELTLGL